jgi:hypothetical protein
LRLYEPWEGCRLVQHVAVGAGKQRPLTLTLSLEGEGIRWEDDGVLEWRRTLQDESCSFADGVFHLTRAAACPSPTSERDCGRWGDIGQTGPFTMDGAHALTLTLSLRERGAVARTVGSGE